MMLTDAGRRKRKRCYADDDDNKKNGAKVGGEKAAAVAETVCSRCGRNSHTVAHCYAKTHFNGTPLLLREGRDDGKVEEEKKEKEENMPKKKDGGGNSGNGDVGKSSGGSSSSSRVIKSKYFSAAQGSALNSGTQQRPFSSLELLRMYRGATYYW